MKRMANLLFACMLSSIVFATGGINFVNNMTWAEVKARALKENKMIFFDAYTTWCGPCKYLDKSVYTDTDVADYYNSNFINVKFDMEEGEGQQLAEEFGITSYPTLLFFSPAGNLVHKYIGAMEAPEFINLGKEARDPAKQYYTLRQKIVDNKATTVDFIKWTEMANELEDKNRGSVASDWLSTQSDILANADLARATLLYTDVNETQLTYLYKEKAKVARLLGWSSEKTNEQLYRKLFTLAIQRLNENKTNTTAFAAVINRHQPSKLNYAMTELQMIIAFSEGENQKAMGVLVSSVKGNRKISLDEMAVLFIDYSPRFENTDVKELKLALDAYKFTTSDKGHEWGLYLAQVICYSKLDDYIKARGVAEKAYRHPNLPGLYKPILKESYGLN